MFVYHQKLSTLELKKDKGTKYVIGWKSKGLFQSKLFPLHAFLPKIKYFGYKIGIQFNNSPLVVQENNYATKTINAYIVCDLDNWPRIPLDNFTLKKLFGVTNITKDSDNNFARNVINFWVYNFLSSHADNGQINFLVLGKGSTDDINSSNGATKKKFCIDFSKAKTNFF